MRRTSQPAQPALWYRPDTIVCTPSFADTIAPPLSYTMMMVYRTLRPQAPQPLWRISRTDSVFYAITTHGLRTERLSPSARTSSTPRTEPAIYTLQQTLRPDTAYHDICQLHIGACPAEDSSHIALYEAAYFAGRLTRRQSLMFQTYLAVKHGITLDNAPYLSTSGDTLWHHQADKTFYHRIHGIGTDTVYPLNAFCSRSLEDSLLHLFAAVPLPVGTYALVGDDDMPLGWSSYEDRHALQHRTWLLATTGMLPQVSIALHKDRLPDAPDTLSLLLLSPDGTVIRAIDADSANAEGQLCYTLSHPASRTLFSFLATDGSSHPRRSASKDLSSYGTDDDSTPAATPLDDMQLSLTPNPTHGEYTLSLSLTQSADLFFTIQDPTGKVVTHQSLTGAADYRHSGFLPVAGMYLFSLYTPDGELLATRQLLVY